MSRVLKFRVWDLEQNYWATQTNLAGRALDGRAGWTTNLWPFSDENRYVIEQFTGTRGSFDGNEVWEGDIVATYYEEHGSPGEMVDGPCYKLTGHKYVVICLAENYGYFGKDNKFERLGLAPIKIMGNIHENNEPITNIYEP